MQAISDAGPSTTAVPLPQGDPGIGFDDLQFAPHLKKLLAPGGRSGNLDLVDPDTGAVTAIAGFSTSDQYSGGHDFGTTSAVEGPSGYLLVLDRTTSMLHVVDPVSKAILNSTMVAAQADYVRWVDSTREAWVTEPNAGQLEIFTLSMDTPPMPSHATAIGISGGPESLVIDGTRGRAYTNSFVGSTYAFDLQQRSVVEAWPNGCAVSLGLALDERRGFVFVGCSAGEVVTLDVANGGNKLSTATVGAGVDILAYSAATGHLYVPAAGPAILAILGVSAAGELSSLATLDGAGSCAAADDRGNAWVCDPARGQLLRVTDPFPATK